jgi:hypothetical protein
MKIFSSIVTLSILVLSTLGAMVLAIANPFQVTVVLGFLELKMTVGQVLVMSFALGALFGLMGILYAVVSNQIAVKMLQGKLHRIKAELDSLRSNGINQGL